jgi:hypothetical protein
MGKQGHGRLRLSFPQPVKLFEREGIGRIFSRPLVPEHGVREHPTWRRESVCENYQKVKDNFCEVLRGRTSIVLRRPCIFFVIFTLFWVRKEYLQKFYVQVFFVDDGLKKRSRVIF